MSDELDRDTGALVNRLLERENDEHLRGDRFHRPDTARPPCPELRADVVDDGDPKRASAPSETEIEIWKVDRHKHIGSVVHEALPQAVKHLKGAWQHAKRFGEAGDRE